MSQYTEQLNFFSIDQLISRGSEVNVETIDYTAGSIEIFPSTKNEIYSRVYLQLGDIAASVGGVFKILLLIGNFIMIIPYEFHFYQSIMNEILIYDYDGASKRNKKTEDILVINKNSNNSNNKTKLYKNFELDSSRNLNDRSNVEGSKISSNSNLQNNIIVNQQFFKPNDLLDKNNFCENDHNEISKYNSINFNSLRKDKTKSNNENLRTFSNQMNHNISSDSKNVKNLQENKTLDIKKKLEGFKALFKEKKQKKFEFSTKEILAIKFACLFKKSIKSKQRQIAKIYQVKNYLDFFKIIKILRDSVLLKKILLTKEQHNGMKFLNRELNLEDEWNFSDIDIISFIEHKNKGFFYQNKNIYDKNIKDFISKEIFDLL